MSANVSPASAIAASHACDGQRQRRHHQSPPDRRHADPGEGDLVLELLRGQHGPDVFAEAFRRDFVGGQGSALGVRDRPEQRKPHVLDLLEDDLDLLAEFELARDRSPRCWWSAERGDLPRSPPAAITYGAGSPGRLNRSLMVKPASVALPETARTPMSRERQ